MSKPDFEKRERESPTCTLLWLINCGGKKKNRGIEKGSWQGGYVRRQAVRRGLTGE
jgi:hypothetical protein